MAILTERAAAERRAVITEIERMAIPDILALLDARFLTERATRRAQIAAELAALDSDNARDADEIATIRQTASERATQEAAGQRATAAIAQRHTQINALQAEAALLAAGQVTVDRAGINLTYDLGSYINPKDPDDAAYTTAARDARLQTNPFIVALADGRLNRAELIAQVCATAQVKVPAAYALYAQADAVPPATLPLTRWHTATNRAVARLSPRFGRWLASPVIMLGLCVVCVLSVCGVLFLAFAVPSAPLPTHPPP